MVRAEWLNLNGLWNYAILPAGERPGAWDGEILVPFAAESSLSGVGRRVGAEQELWYERTFDVPAKWAGRRVLLHFGAVDWRTDVWVNGVSLGRHEGGYTPFEFDVTPVLRKGANTLRVRVWDPTDDGYQPRGKQVKHPEVVWYTPVTGIWQTVWLECVPQQYIRSVVATPDPDRRTFRVAAATFRTGAPRSLRPRPCAALMPSCMWLRRSCGAPRRRTSTIWRSRWSAAARSWTA